MATKVDKEQVSQFVSGLRELADLYEKNGPKGLPIPDWGVTVSLEMDQTKPKENGQWSWETEPDDEATKRYLKKCLRLLGRGKKEKKYTEYSFTVRKELSPLVRIELTTNRESVCRKVPTGKKIVHPATTHTYTTEQRVEEEFEWVCDDPLLAPPVSV